MILDFEIIKKKLRCRLCSMISLSMVSSICMMGSSNFLGSSRMVCRLEPRLWWWWSLHLQIWWVGSRSGRILGSMGNRDSCMGSSFYRMDICRSNCCSSMVTSSSFLKSFFLFYLLLNILFPSLLNALIINIINLQVCFYMIV